VSNFRDVYDALTAARAVEAVRDGATLAAVVKRLIDDDAARQRLAREAYACIERFTGALERTVEALDPYLAPLCRKHETSSSA
jgi:3-deoxy-D-manno-octulosonic-acid transferase